MRILSKPSVFLSEISHKVDGVRGVDCAHIEGEGKWKKGPGGTVHFG